MFAEFVVASAGFAKRKQFDVEVDGRVHLAVTRLKPPDITDLFFFYFLFLF